MVRAELQLGVCKVCNTLTCNMTPPALVQVAGKGIKIKKEKQKASCSEHGLICH
jgi:hypothetical protein